MILSSSINTRLIIRFKKNSGRNSNTTNSLLTEGYLGLFLSVEKVLNSNVKNNLILYKASIFYQYTPNGKACCCPSQQAALTFTEDPLFDGVVQTQGNRG
jgi:hypothetical protein